jgi:hypothetical protein
MLTHIFFAFAQVITRFISCANSFANSHSERGSSAIFGFEAFFSAQTGAIFDSTAFFLRCL